MDDVFFFEKHIIIYWNEVISVYVLIDIFWKTGFKSKIAPKTIVTQQFSFSL